MKKESFSYEVKSAYLTRQNLEGIVDLLIELSDEDDKTDESTYKRTPQFSFSLKNGYECDEDDKGDFLKKIDESKLDMLRTLSLNYSGINTSIRIAYRKGSTDSIDVKIETSDRKNYPFYRDKILQLLGEGNWNWVMHSYPILMVIMLLFWSVILIFTRLSNVKFYHGMMEFPKILISLMTPSILWFVFSTFPARFYPKLIIELDSKRFGRNLKSDLWKIISFIIIVIIVPIIINHWR